MNTLKKIDRSRAGYNPLLREIASVIIPGVRYTAADINLVDDMYVVSIRAMALSLQNYLQQVDHIMNRTDGLMANAVINNYTINLLEGNPTVSFSLSLNVPIDGVNEAQALPSPPSNI